MAFDVEVDIFEILRFYWQASHTPGLSREQATLSAAVIVVA
jgi:hypothetical protein